MPGRVTIRFYEELNDFLPVQRRKVEFACDAGGPRSIKDLIESLGVPHTEVDLVLVDGRSVGFGFAVRDGQRISVYPRFESLDVTPLTRLRPAALRDTRFVLDTHLGRLAAYLRMLGFDTLYRNDYDDPTLVDVSVSERRVLLTCDRGLLMRRDLERGYFVRARQPREQLREVLERLDLFDNLRPFTRCMHCNGAIEPVDKAAVVALLPPRTATCYDAFWRCAQCGKIYWQGSHYRRMRVLLERLGARRPGQAPGSGR